MQKSDVSLPVELSGWDDEYRFFVEYSILDFRELGQKTLLRWHVVQRHAVIFIRALFGKAFAKSHSGIHRVETREPAERLAYNELHLRDFHPHHNGAGEPKIPVEHPISVRDEVKR